MSAKTQKHRQRGVALVAVMLTLLLVTAIAAALLILANTETYTSANFMDEQKALFGAKAGIEEARDRLRKNQTYSITRPTGLVGSGSSAVLYILNPASGETVAPWDSTNKYADDEICKETFSGGTNLTCTTNSTSGKTYPSGSYYTTANADSTFAPASGSVLNWKWARVTLKQNNAFGTGYYVNGSSSDTSQVLWNGNSECTSGSTCTLPVYVITALGMTANGSRRMVQMEVAEDQLNFTAPSALTLDGTGDQFSGGTASGWSVKGTDTAVAGCGATTGPAVTAVGVTNGTMTTTTTYGNNGNGVGNAQTTTTGTGDVGNVINGYGTGSGIPTQNQSSYVGLAAAPDVANVSTLSSWTTDQLNSYSNLVSLVSALKNDVTQPVVAGGTQLSGGGALFNSSSSSPQIVYANGDLTITGSGTGYGILVVTGNLTLKGTVTWNGIILNIGGGNMQVDGTNQINGAVVVAKTSTGAITIPTFGVNGGGNAGVNYSSGCITQAKTLTTFHSVSYRELIR